MKSTFALMRKTLTSSIPYVFFALLLIGWQFVVESFDIPRYILPAPSEIIRRLVSDYQILYLHTAITLYEAVAGFLLACIIGIVVALLINVSSLVEKIVYPYAIMAKVIPVVAIAPLIMIWFGFGVTPKIFISALVSFFPVVVNTVKGLKSTDPQMVKLMKSLSASPAQIFIKLKIPSSMPYVFSGFKVAITLSVVGAIVGELVGADKGIGHLIMVAQAYLDTELIFSAIFVSAALGLVLFSLISFLEKILMSWYEPID